MTTRLNSRSNINKLNIASMAVLLVIVIFFMTKDMFSFEVQKWIYLFLGLVLIAIDLLRIKAARKGGNRKLLIVRVITLVMVTGFVCYWLWLHFL